MTEPSQPAQDSNAVNQIMPPNYQLNNNNYIKHFWK